VKTKLYLLLFLTTLIISKTYSQNKIIDSLKFALSFCKEDTNKVKTLNAIAWELKGIKPDTSILLINQALPLSQKLKWKIGEAQSELQLGVCYIIKGESIISLEHQKNAIRLWDDLILSKDKTISLTAKIGKIKSTGNIGTIYSLQANYPKALEYYFEAKKISEELNLKQLQANNLGNIGNVYTKQANYPKALEYYFEAMKISEELNLKQLQANNLGNIGNVYTNQKNYSKALECYLKASKIAEELNLLQLQGTNLGNIGIVHKQKGDYAKALNYLFKALKIEEKLHNKDGISRSYGNIGNVYKAQKKYSEASDYYFKAKKIKEELGDKYGIAFNLSNIGSLYIKTGKFKEAEEYLKNSLLISKNIKALDLIKEQELSLSQLYDTIGKPALAFIHYKKYIATRDSINSEENQKKQVQSEMNYEFEKKELAAKAEQEKKDAVVNKEKQKQRIVLFFVLGVLILVVIFFGFLYNRFKITKKQKHIIEIQKHKVDEAYEELHQQNEEIASQRDEIESQKHVIEAHQKEMIDSITYAKRIQDAILPPLNLINEKFPNSFVLYKPKDIVAGDFYWMEEIGDTIVIAAADCTGHGVPGAMVSVVCSNALNRAVKEFNLSETGKILDKVRELVIETFVKSNQDVKDGMDISILSINKVSKEIKWSGANNPLWYFDENNLNEITADKQPIGKSVYQKPFTTHNIEYKTGTTFYLFTDGYADQFGGPKGKKFMYKQFKDTISKFLNQDSDLQQIELNNAFENWKGDLEQVDDVSVIGIKIS
jgi:tetratricopeptide (TPR) repeat protein